MSERTHLLVQRWLQQAQPQHSFNENLQQLSLTYPYFSAAHLLLLKKSNSTTSAEQKKMAALHVYNPLFLENEGLEKMFDFPFEDQIESDSKPILTETTNIVEVISNDEVLITPQQEEIDIAEEGNGDEAVSVHSEEETITIDHIETATEQPEINATRGEPALNMPKLNLNAPAADITFEPYHTVDYFASQGIKLSQTDATNDQFGKQLKSFTEWLKTMKKLPTTAITHNTDGVGERKVENLAAHSLQNTDIITESMAEVWVKQGNLQKASEVYNKLSLQNPSKKAYFAAKIESLKKPS